MADDEEALYEFARRGKMQPLQELLDSGVSPEGFVAYDGSTALVVAARKGSSEAVKLLIERRAHLDTRTDDGSSVLVHAVSGGSAEAVSLLLATNADPNEVNEDGLTPLLLASEKGGLEVAQRLIEARADFSYVAEEWGSALDIAVEGNHEELIQFLTKLGVKSSPPKQDLQERKVAAGEQWGYDAFDGEKDY